MTRPVTRRMLLGGLAGLAVAGPVSAGPPTMSLRPRARGHTVVAKALGGPEALVAKSGLSGKVAFAVADMGSGQVLEDMNPGVGLPPASVTKAVTALYALEVLGAGHRFETRVLAVGNITDGVLQGDLILQGGGDPSLDTDGLAELVAQMKAAGLREVRGRFLVDEGALPFVRTIDKGQLDHVGYSPAVSGIALNHNRVHFEWKRNGGGYAVTMDARTRRFRPDVSMARMRIEDRGLPVYTYADRGGVDEWTVARKALGKGGARWLPVRKPGAYAGDVFRTLARAHGIVLPGAKIVRKAPAAGQVLAKIPSEPLEVILRGMLKYSNNLTAEMVGLAASARLGGRPMSLKVSAGRMSDWAAGALGMGDTRLVDHSGLGDASRMAAGDMARALAESGRAKVLRPLLKPVKMRDAKGRPVPDHPVTAQAKTGTLFFVSSLAGYMTARDGTDLAFAILTVDAGRREIAKQKAEERPPGAKGWNRRSKALQQMLIERWGTLYGS